MDSSKNFDVSCNQCGAALQVSGTTRFVTCPSCKARLAVRMTGDTVLTELADAPAAQENPTPAAETMQERAEAASKAAQIAEKLQTSLENFVANEGTALPRKPSAVAGIVSIVLGILAGGFILALVRNGAPAFFLVLAFLFFGAGIYNGFKAINLASKQR